MKWFRSCAAALFIVFSGAAAFADIPLATSSSGSESKNVFEQDGALPKEENQINEEGNIYLHAISAKNAPDAERTTSVPEETCDAASASSENALMKLVLIILGSVALVILFGLICGLCGAIVIYASWWDLALSGSVIVSFLFSIIAASKFGLYIFMIPLVLALALLIRGRHLNRSIFKAIIAFPTQIAGISIVAFLFMLSASAIFNAFQKNKFGHYKNSRAEIAIFLFLAGLFALLGTGALKLIQWLIRKGRENATRLVFDDLEEERRKRNHEKKKSIMDSFRESYYDGYYGDDPEYKAKKDAEAKQTKEACMAGIVRNEEYYAQVLGISKGVTSEDVKKAYRKKSKEYHPDRVAGLGEKLKEMAESEMRDINEAYTFFQGKLGFS